jgi:iron complex outermembrane receptor protein
MKVTIGMNKAIRRRCLCGSVSLAALMSAATAHAQSAAVPTQPKRGNQLETIVVTAQKRSQNVQSVPISVTAIPASTLKANRVTSVADLAGLAPNIAVRATAGGTAIPAFTIRGITSYGVVPGSDKETSIYLDGVYIGSPRASTFELPDVERIEVLRGPQGTLFGRNATTGAVSVITRDPTGKLGAHQDLTVGNYNEFRSRTTVDLPAWGPFSGYASFVHDERDGDIKNNGAGTVWDRSGPATRLGTETSPSTLGAKDANTYFVALKYQPTDYFKTIYKFDLSNNDFTPEGEGFLGYNPTSPLVGPLLNALITSQPNPVQIVTNGKRPSSVNDSFSTPGTQHNEGHSLTSNYIFNDQLTFKNILAYREADIESASQLDGLGGLTLTKQAVLPAAILAAYSSAPPALAASLIPTYAQYYGSQVGKRYQVLGIETQSFGRQYSEEMQANFTSRWLTLTTGGTWFHSIDRSGGAIGLANNYAFETIPSNGRVPLGNESTSFNLATSYAGYTQAEVHVLPKLDLVGGFRLTHDDKSGYFVSGGTYIPGPGGSFTNGSFVNLITSPFTYSKTKPTYSIGLNYKPVKDSLIYMKYSTGYVSGGAVGGVSFLPETVASWDLGFKADLLNHRLRGSIALFNADYGNVQSAQGGTNVGHPELGTVIITQGDVHARGFEAEAAARPLEGLTLTGSVGYTYTFFGTVNPILLESVGGSYYPTLVPRWTSSVSAQYETAPIYNDAYLVFRADANYHTKENSHFNPAYEYIPGFGNSTQIDPATIVNARVSLTNIALGSHNAEIALWVRNLTDDKDLLFPDTFGNFAGAGSFQAARTYGADFSFNF